MVLEGQEYKPYRAVTLYYTRYRYMFDRRRRLVSWWASCASIFLGVWSVLLWYVQSTDRQIVWLLARCDDPSLTDL